MGDLWCALFGHSWHRMAHWCECELCCAILPSSAQIPEDAINRVGKGEK